MYKVKRFSYVESLTKGATLLGTLGAATGASAGLLGEYDKEIKIILLNHHLAYLI